MSSGFLVQNYEEAEGERIELEPKGSSRYRFYKMRQYGMLHFVKCPAPGFENDMLTIESLRKEFLCGYGLSHPNIAKYLRYENGEIFEEYIDGHTLREMVDNGDSRLNDHSFIQAVCLQLLSAVDYLHSKGIVHNDLKPENVMISNIGDIVKVIDLSGAQTSMLDSTPGFTAEYKAPEQGLKNSFSPNTSTDFYHVGRIMKELVEGRTFERKWQPFISRATSEDSSKRFGSTDEAQAMIPTDKKNDKKRLLSLLSTTVVIVVLSISFFFFLREKPVENVAVIENDTILKTKTVEITDNIETPISPNPAETSDTEKPSKNATETKAEILKKIDTYAANTYRSEALQVVDDFSLDDVEGQLGNRHYDAVIKALDTAREKSFAYAETMSGKYPQWADDISNHIVQTITTQQSKYGYRLHSYYESNYHIGSVENNENEGENRGDR